MATIHPTWPRPFDRSEPYPPETLQLLKAFIDDKATCLYKGPQQIAWLTRPEVEDFSRQLAEWLAQNPDQPQFRESSEKARAAYQAEHLVEAPDPKPTAPG